MWSYRPLNWIKINPNERCAPCLLDLGGLRRLWLYNCSDEALKMGNSVSPDNTTILQKMIWFLCVYIQKLLNGSLLRVHNTLLKIKRSKWIQDFPNTYKYPSSSMLKGCNRKKGKEKKKRIRKDKEKKVIIARNTRLEVQKKKSQVFLSFVSLWEEIFSKRKQRENSCSRYTL